MAAGRGPGASTPPGLAKLCRQRPQGTISLGRAPVEPSGPPAARSACSRPCWCCRSTPPSWPLWPCTGSRCCRRRAAGSAASGSSWRRPWGATSAHRSRTRAGCGHRAPGQPRDSRAAAHCCSAAAAAAAAAAAPAGRRRTALGGRPPPLCRQARSLSLLLASRPGTRSRASLWPRLKAPIRSQARATPAACRSGGAAEARTPPPARGTRRRCRAAWS
mmetsp:Transcript_73875/g.216795  ORF Transcript_73875/g.216795 Transcript_73875/m.216795 type:complete len:218 (-) Transcript_73875:522-1175(-)